MRLHGQFNRKRSYVSGWDLSSCNVPSRGRVVQVSLRNDLSCGYVVVS